MAEETSQTPKQKLRADISKDISMRSEWFDKRLRLRGMRLGERRKNLPYRNAPNFVDPIIDDNVRSITSSENQILWSGRAIANFLPLNEEAAKLKRHAEIAFNTLLKFTLNIRAKVESLLDTKNQDGMAIAKMISNHDDYLRLMGEDAVIPDFEDVDPLDVYVPTGTREIKNAVRITHVLKLSEGELRRRADRGDWKNVEQVILACRRDTAAGHGTRGSTDDDAPAMIGLIRSDPSVDKFVLWEVYHEEKGERTRTIMCPDNAEIEIKSIPWEWPEVQQETVVVDEQTGEATGVVEEIGLPIRRWPFFQFRFEGRTRDYYDVRGGAEMLEDNQKIGTQFLNIRGTHFDFYGKPLLSGGSQRAGLAKFKWQPGEMMPEGVAPAQLPQLDPALDFSVDRERANAARRVGGSQGGLLSAQNQRERKTATEVNKETGISTGLTSDSIQRFAEPFSDLFTEMWTFLKHHPIKLPMINTQLEFRGFTEMAIFDAKFIVIASPNAMSANPQMVLQQLTQLSPFLQNNPAVDIIEFTRMLVDQIDPHLTDRVVLDPNRQEGEGVPLVQQVQGLQGAVQQLAEQVQGIGQALGPILQEMEIRDRVEQQAQGQGASDRASVVP